MSTFNTEALTAEMIAKTAEIFAERLWEGATVFFKDLKSKNEINFGSAFEEYLKTYYNKYSKVKTILYRQPQFIYTFYECVGLMYENTNISTEDVYNVTQISNKIVITGTGGIGKSTMLRHFFLNCIQKKCYIPVLIELRIFNDKAEDNIDIYKEIYKALDQGRFHLEDKYFKYSLERGEYLILYDGYDELKEEKAAKVASEILGLSTKFPINHYIISSRPTNDFLGWNDYVEVKSLPLTKKQALSLINKINYDEDIKASFSKTLEDNLFDNYESFASNPLLLTIMLITFENHATIPDKLNEFYEQAFLALFNSHDSTKGAFRRDIKSDLNYDDFKKIFSYFCFKSFFENKYSFYECDIIKYINLAKGKVKTQNEFDSIRYKEDLENAVCMLVKEGLRYNFSHRSFQEYFAAVYLESLPDDIQKKFLISWMKSARTFRHTNLLNMLYDIENERFLVNILVPLLEEIQKKCGVLKDSVDNYCLLAFSGICLIDTKNSIGLLLNNNYYDFIVSMASGLEGNINYNINNKNSEAAHEILFKYILDNDGKTISMERLMKDDMLKYVKGNYCWIEESYDLAMMLLKRRKEMKTNKKVNFDGLLDQL